MEAKTIERIAEELGVNFYDLHPYIVMRESRARREVVEFINDLITGIEGCKFEERLDGDKGCIVLDMNENQWQAKLKEWVIEL